MRCAVLLLTHNGLDHVRTALPSLVCAARNVAAGCRVVVVDNRSTDGTVDWVRQEHPDVECVIAPRNDCLFSLNQVVAACAEEIVALVNNDMRFDPEFLAVMLPHFSDPAVFAVTARTLGWDGQDEGRGHRTGHVRRFWFYRQWRASPPGACRTLIGDGGATAFRRRMFVELGGFDPLYRPGYFEDADLSYRAWRRGWPVIFEPASVVYHRRGATFDRQPGGRDAVTRLIARNEVLFAARNVGGWGFVAGYLALLPWRTARNAALGRRALAAGMAAAVPRLPQALAGRYRDPVTGSDDRRFLADIAAGSRV